MKQRNSLKNERFEDIVARNRYFKILSLFAELTSKILTVTTPLISIIGLIFVLIYLKDVGLEREFVSVVSSPTVLVAIAMYSIFIAIFLALILTLPGMLVFFGSQQWEFGDYSDSKGKVFILISSLFMFSLLVLTLSLYFTEVKDHDRLGILILVLIILLGIFLSSRQSWIHEKRPFKYRGFKVFNKCNLESFLLSTTATSFGLVILLFSIYLILKATYYLIGGEGFSFWVVLTVVYFLYSALVASVICLKDSFFAIHFLALICGIVYLLFQSEVSSNVISKLGIGNYSSSYTVKSESVENLRKDVWKSKDNEFLIKSNGNVTELKNIWVILSLKEKVIISPSDSSKIWISIPTSAIVNEGVL